VPIGKENNKKRVKTVQFNDEKEVIKAEDVDNQKTQEATTETEDSLIH